MTWMAGRPRTRRELTVAALVLAGLVGFVVLVYVAVVLGVGALVGRTSRPSLLLSVVATVVVALAFDPVQTLLEGAAGRVVHGGPPPPYEVWERFSSTVTASAPARELPVRMARVLAEGTGAREAQVWLLVHGRPVLAGAWPPGLTGSATLPDAGPGHEGEGVRSLPVRHAGEVLGLLVVRERTPLTSVEERLFRGLADQAGLVLHSARLRVELEQRAAQLSGTAEELTASRQRLVDVQDERRRVLERDIHDGAQQHLVALAVNLRLAERLMGRSPDRAHALLREQQRATRETVETLVRLARGIYPPLLSREGLVAALRAEAATSPVPVTIEAAGTQRYDAGIEAAAYFCCLEALQNATKHAGATAIRLRVEAGPDELVVEVEDDGRGFVPGGDPVGEGLTNIRDRVESVGGRLALESAAGQGTRLQARFSTVVPAAPGGRS